MRTFSTFHNFLHNKTLSFWRQLACVRANGFRILPPSTMPGRTAITLSTKIEIMKELDKLGTSLKVVADKFKIGKTTVADIK